MSESREPMPRAEFGRVGCVATVDVCGHGGCAYVRWEGGIHGMLVGVRRGRWARASHGA